MLVTRPIWSAAISKIVVRWTRLSLATSNAALSREIEDKSLFWQAVFPALQLSTLTNFIGSCGYSDAAALDEAERCDALRIIKYHRCTATTIGILSEMRDYDTGVHLGYVSRMNRR